MRGVPELHIKHKEPNDKWWFMTNIPIEFSKELESKRTTENQTKTSKYDLKVVYLAMKELKSQKGRKRLTWDEVCHEMEIKQKNGEVVYHSDFSTVKPNTIQHAFAVMKKMFETEESQD